MQCPNCGGQIKEADMNYAQGLAICPYCDTVHNISQQTRTPERINMPRKGVQKRLRNRRIRIEHTPRGLIITREWFGRHFWIYLFMGGFWNLITWAILIGMVASGDPVFSGVTLFLSGHIVVGLWMAYEAVTRMVNSTLIVISPESIEISHGPIPAPGNKIIPLDNIAQFFVKRSNSVTEINGKEYYTYNVFYMLQDNKQKALIRGVDQVTDALFIEQEIETYLGIDDVPVQDEIESESAWNAQAVAKRSAKHK